MKNKINAIGYTMIGFMLGGLTISGANQVIQAIQNTEVKVSLNGQIQEFRDETTGEIQYPITYNDRTYLPLRNVAQLAGLYVGWDSATSTALLSSTPITSNANEQTTSVETTENVNEQATSIESTQNTNPTWQGKFINNLDGYIELTIEKKDDKTMHYSIRGYKEGRTKLANDTATISNGVAIGNRFKFVYEGTNIRITTSEENLKSFEGLYKLDDGTITKIEKSLDKLHNKYSNESKEIIITLDEQSNGNVKFIISIQKDGIGSYTSKIGYLNFSNGVAFYKQDFLGATEEYTFTLGSNELTVEATSSDKDSSIDKFNGVYQIDNSEETIEYYKSKINGRVSEGAIMF